MGLINVKKLIALKLPADGYRLALAIADKAVPVTGLVHCSNAQYAEEIGVGNPRISKLMRRLQDAALIYRLNPRVLVVNPFWCFRGSPKEHAVAVKQWGRLHPLGAIPNQQDTAA